MATDEMGTAQPTPALVDLPPEVLDNIMSLLHPRDLASLNATARLFHAAPPGGCSAVERALRERARARGHEHALPATLPSDVRTWTGELLARERVLELACAHASSVVCDASFSAFVDAEGGLHTCGEEEVLDEDEAVLDWNAALLTGERIPPAAIGHVGARGVRVPTHVSSLSAVRVRSVAAGWTHLLALSEAGAVYGCGSNCFSQLGLGALQERREFVPVAALADFVVVGIAAGGNHSLALSTAGCAYSWGDNYYGQLGHGDTEERWEPTRIEALDGVRVGGLAAGHEHTLLLTTRGAVYSCGIGQLGQLGHGDVQDQRTPRRIEALAGVRAVHVSAGCHHSLVVDSDWAVHSFGAGTCGQLGRVDLVGRRKPKRIEALAGVHVVRACAGNSSSAVLGADGSVHTFGDNEYGQLGLEKTCLTVPTPTRVAALAHARVVHCAMRSFHSLFVSADGRVYACGKRSAALGLGMSAAEQDEPTQRVDTPTCVETGWRARAC